ncbi:MAG: DUF5056 domain-containing protein [Tannerella sp.]|nr:DUF5056 domain-containing protein [Tannerella sp.]
MEINDSDLKRIFEMCRHEIADDGFSRRLRDALPPRPSYMPQIVMCICAMAGIMLVFTILGFESIADNILGIVESLSRQEWPSAAAVSMWLGIVCCTGIVGYAVAAAE